jgi:hypothetical protein
MNQVSNKSVNEEISHFHSFKKELDELKRQQQEIIDLLKRNGPKE